MLVFSEICVLPYLPSFHPVAHRDNGIEIEVLHLIGFAIGSSCCIFCNNCLTRQLGVLEYVVQVARYTRFVPVEEFSKLLKTQLDSLLIGVQLNFDSCITSLINNDGISALLGHGVLLTKCQGGLLLQGSIIG